MFHVPESYRDKTGPLRSTFAMGNNGVFIIPHHRIHNYEYNMQVSDGMGWEHVSITVRPVGQKATRCPTWEEMCHIKSLFWDDEDCVLQYHPPKSEYVSCHPYCLHLWRPTAVEFPRPQSIMVGPDSFKKK